MATKSMKSDKNVNKQLKYDPVVSAINKIWSHLALYLPLGNAHMTDFIVHNWWEKMVISTVRADLCRLDQESLAQLPSGRLYQQNDPNSDLDLDIADDIFFVVCGEREKVLQGHKHKWDPFILPTWIHKSLQDFIMACQQRTLTNLNVLTSLNDILGKEDIFNSIQEFMSSKKCHEVEIMAELCAQLANDHNLTEMIDLGSGKGYLGSYLSLKHGLRVLGIDSSCSNTHGAADRSQRLSKQWNGLVSRSKQKKNKTVTGPLNVHQTQSSPEKDKNPVLFQSESTECNQIEQQNATDSNTSTCTPITVPVQDDSDINTTVSSVTLNEKHGLFVPITQFVDKNTDLQALLSTHILNGVLPGEKSDMCSPSTIQCVTDLENKSDNAQSSSQCTIHVSSSCSCASYSTRNISSDNSKGSVQELSSQIQKNSPVHYMIGGLHACGDLTSNTLRLYLEHSDARVLCNVGCCYHHLTEAFVKCPFGKSADLPFEDAGFPLSDYLRSRGCQLGRNARMLASQAPDRIAENGKPPGIALYWRSLLQVILRDLTGEIRDDWMVGKIAAKCSNFKVYVHKALEKLGFKNMLTDDQIEQYETDYQDYQAKIQCFVQLKSAVAPCIEALILLDRMCYLLEQNCIEDVHLIQAFDPVKSPRCYALVAWKKTSNDGPSP